METRYGDQGALDKYEDKNNGDCNTGSVKHSCRLYCAICRKWVGSNSIFFVFCEHWVHKRYTEMNRYTGMKGRSVPDYKCRKCTGEFKTLEGLLTESLVVINESLEEVNKFCND